VEQKRHDTNFILVTDGITWKQRLSDLRKTCKPSKRRTHFKNIHKIHGR
jgi:hypothetical protein